MNTMSRVAPMALLTVFFLNLGTLAVPVWAGAPGASKLGARKVLTLVVRDPPWVRCNNNIQVAAELANVYQIPVQVVPHAFAGPGAKAPAVYYGDELIAEDGGKGNGMVSFTEMSDMLEVEGAPRHKQEGRLLAKEPKPQHEALKAAIKDVK
ncbi:hypothetical protein BURK2_04530 [Burkholderiales bacterium]|nr:MAG: hypothetical protein F9K47_12445 [Burkholderiales bacterium]CAG1012496.1 hypothetical protein BURK2_04530 [Burkholderiales bacterium]